MANSNIVHLNGANWDAEVVKSPVPVLVDFWAEWCGPCRMLGPVLDEVSGELAGKVKIGKVNVDENQELAAKFQVRSIPTMLFFDKGAVKSQMVGALRKADLLAKIDANLKG